MSLAAAYGCYLTAAIYAVPYVSAVNPYVGIVSVAAVIVAASKQVAVLNQVVAANLVIGSLIINFLLVFLIDFCSRGILCIFIITVAYVTVIHSKVSGSYYTAALTSAVCVPFNRGNTLVIVVVRAHVAQTCLGLVNSNHHIGHACQVITQNAIQQRAFAQCVSTYGKRQLGGAYIAFPAATIDTPYLTTLNKCIGSRGESLRPVEVTYITAFTGSIHVLVYIAAVQADVSCAAYGRFLTAAVAVTAQVRAFVKVNVCVGYSAQPVCSYKLALQLGHAFGSIIVASQYIV